MLEFVKTKIFIVLMLTSSVTLSAPYYHTLLGLDKALEITEGSPEITVAIISSGINYENLDQISSVARGSEGELGFNAIDCSGDVRDQMGYGSETTSIITSRAIGVAKKVRIIPIKVLSEFGSTNAYTLEKGIEYAVKRKANIIVTAIGGRSGNSEKYCKGLKMASDNGAIIVVNPGNSASELPDDYFPASCNIPNMLVVATTDRYGRPTKTTNYSSTKVHIGSPGEQIQVIDLDNNQIERSAGSYATFLAAGLVALVWSDNPDQTGAMVKTRIMNSVTKIKALEGKVVSGGIINAYKALIIQ